MFIFGIANTLYVGLFYIIGIVSVIGMLPSSLMDWFEKKMYKNPTKYIEVETEKNPDTLILQISKYIINGFTIFIFSFCLIMNLGSVKSFPYGLEPKIINFGKDFKIRAKIGECFRQVF